MLKRFFLIAFSMFLALSVLAIAVNFDVSLAENPKGIGLDKTFESSGGILPGNLPKLDIKLDPKGEGDPVQLVESVLLKFVINPIFFIAGGVAIIVVMYSAARIMFARGEEEGITAAKNTLIWAALGLGLILLSYTIINNLAGLIGKFF